MQQLLYTHVHICTYSHVRHLHSHTSRSDSARRVFDMFSVTAKYPLCTHIRGYDRHEPQSVVFYIKRKIASIHLILRWKYSSHK
ncbi:hypothetical protein PUN28_003488 [Cardiocondyla obscurior]|uniref:Uncharacterized protein n=1 Tax=Cardiocondyla obscurior TaxID=286306 RepID=A0AAW2GJ82_9HYME